MCFLFIGSVFLLLTGPSVLLQAHPFPLRASFNCLFIKEEKQHKHKFIGPDFPRTFPTLTPGCPGVKKFLPATRTAGKRIFSRGRPRFSVRTSMTRRVAEKLCTKKNCVDFLAPSLSINSNCWSRAGSEKLGLAPKVLQDLWGFVYICKLFCRTSCR